MNNPIYIRQSELNRVGFGGNFMTLRYYEKKRIAALTLSAVGRVSEATLLELNNPNAVASITYINDTPLRPVRPGAGFQS